MLHLKYYIESFYIDIILKQNKFVEHIHNTFTVPSEKVKIDSFASSIMKNIVVSPARSRFLVTSVYSIVFGLASSFCCLLKSIAIGL